MLESPRPGAVQFRGIYIGIVASIAALALAIPPAGANAASPVLEFVTPGFPVNFSADGGEVTAALADFDTVVHCGASSGQGEIIGPRYTRSHYAFTGCETQGGSKGGHECKSASAAANEIRSNTVEADLVWINQERHEVGMLLNPDEGTYMSFECGGESVEAVGPFLSPVDPINKMAASFTASLSRSDTTQIPSEYENANGEKRQAIPLGKKGTDPFADTGVQLSFTILPSTPLEIRAVTAKEIEAKQRQEEEAAAARRHQEEEATAKKHQEEAAAKRREEERRQKERARARKRAQQRAKALKQCGKAKSSRKRTRCENRVKKKYDSRRPAK